MRCFKCRFAPRDPALCLRFRCRSATDWCPLLALPLPFCHRLVPLLALPLPFCHRLMPLLAVLQSGRFYCALSLAEAETLRGVIHARHDDPLV